jgi:hypothetical protein
MSRRFKMGTINGHKRPRLQRKWNRKRPSALIARPAVESRAAGCRSSEPSASERESYAGGARPAWETRKESRRNLEPNGKIEFDCDRTSLSAVRARQTPVRDCGETSTASIAPSRRDAQLAAGLLKAAGKADGSTREKTPWPSLRNIATGCRNEVVVSTRSTA